MNNRQYIKFLLEQIREEKIKENKNYYYFHEGLFEGRKEDEYFKFSRGYARVCKNTLWAW